MIENNWTDSLIDRLNEFARENSSEYSEIKTGSEASAMIQQIHGRYNALKSALSEARERLQAIREVAEIDGGDQ